MTTDTPTPVIRVRAENAQRWHDVSSAVMDYRIDIGILHIALDASKLSDGDHNFINSTTPRFWCVGGDEYFQTAIATLPGLGQIRITAWVDIKGNMQRALDGIAAVAEKYNEWRG